MSQDVQIEESAEGQRGDQQGGPPEAKKRSRRFGQPLIFLAAMGVVLVSLAYAVTGTGSGPLREGPAPDFTLDLFAEGRLSLNDLRGQVVVLNFWASWCPPCRIEAPIFEAVSRRYQDRGVTFVGVDYQDTEPPARAFIEEFGITYANGPDPRSRIAQAFGVQGVPETFVINQEGEIAEVFIGSPTEGQLTDVVERLLAVSGDQ